MSELAQAIAERRARLDALRPLSAQTAAALDRWYDVELTYTSNALEGNTLTRIETAIVLEKGITVSGKPLKDHLEATGHLEALHFMRELAAQPDPIREIDVRNLHRLVLEKISPEEAGRYSQHQRAISGSSFTLPSPVELGPLMRDFGLWLEAADATPENSFDAHERLVTIHPFTDGNGRTARLLMNLLLIRAGYPPVPMAPEVRAAYHEALTAVQTRGEREQWHEFMRGLLLASLDEALRILHG
jgi:Fic family protein